MKKILFISSSRADYGLLRDLFIETQKLNKETYLLVTGSHLSKHFGKTIKEIKQDNIKKVIKKNILAKKVTNQSIVNIISKSIESTNEVVTNKKPDVVVILGDRFELLGSAIAAMVNRIPIAHLHGGELTRGAYDDPIRHSISKFSNLHFPIHDKYKKRLIQLGENPNSIFNYGSLGSYSISKSKLFTRSELEKKLNLKLNKKIVIVTFHPVTLEKNKSKHQVKNLIKFLSKLHNMEIIITSPNFDNENSIIKKEFLKFVKQNSNAHYYNSLGNKVYTSLLKITYLVVGNSSSGMMETPSFGTKTINIGTRQIGRITSKNIINSDYDFNSINQSYLKIKKISKKISNPFLKKNTPTKIAKKILNFKFNLKKTFYDIKKI